MPKMIQVRNVPEWLHRELTRRAAERGQTLTAYIQDILEREASQPTLREWLDGIRQRGPIAPDLSSVELIHAERREAGRDA